MDIFKEGTRLGLRIPTSVGLVAIEQLWGLSLTKLANATKEANKKLKQDDDNELSFLDESKPAVNKEDQLIFDILKDVYLTKKAEADAARNAANLKEQKEKIMAIIHSKKEQELNNKTVEELQGMLDGLDGNTTASAPAADAVAAN